MTNAVLLDTCAVIWLANGAPMSAAAMAAILDAGAGDGILASPASAWEIGMLSKDRPNKGPALRFLPDPKTWFARFLAGPGIKETPITPAIAIDASYVPHYPYGDPGDRLIIATARHLVVPIVTRDQRIAAYAETEEIRVISS